MSLFESLVYWSGRHRIASHFLFWLVVFVLTLTGFDPAYQLHESLKSELIKSTFRIFYYMLLAYFIAYLIIPKLMTGRNYVFVVLYFLAGSYVIAAFTRTTGIYLLEPLVRKPPFEQESIGEILTDIPWLIEEYFIHNFTIACIFGFCKLVKEQYLAQQKTLLLEKEKAETELRALKTQLNPHFLFNTLNNIYSLSMLGSPVTSKSIAELAEILDHILYRCNHTYVPVSTEIALLKNYIGLEKLRYNDRLKVNFKHQIDQDVPIAPLILLSLTENAFKHGAGEDIGNPSIDVTLELEHNCFRFVVANSFAPQPNSSKAERIGLDNIKKQLDLIYGKNYALNISANDDIFVVLLTINLNHNDLKNTMPIG